MRNLCLDMNCKVKVRVLLVSGYYVHNKSNKPTFESIRPGHLYWIALLWKASMSQCLDLNPSLGSYRNLNHLTSLCLTFIICKWGESGVLPHRVLVRIKWANIWKVLSRVAATESMLKKWKQYYCYTSYFWLYLYQ